jgi:hypothetical protein
MADNVLHGNEDVTKNNRSGVKAEHPDSAFVSSPHKVESIPEQSAEAAFEDVLRIAGASFKRDAIDTRIVEEARSGKSALGASQNGIIDSQKDVGGWPELKSTQPPVDTDQDGMPDEWEKSIKLNPSDPTDASAFTISKTYSNIEIYFNGLVGWIIGPPKSK